MLSGCPKCGGAIHLECGTDDVVCRCCGWRDLNLPNPRPQDRKRWARAQKVAMQRDYHDNPDYWPYEPPDRILA